MTTEAEQLEAAHAAADEVHRLLARLEVDEMTEVADELETMPRSQLQVVAFGALLGLLGAIHKIEGSDDG